MFYEDVADAGRVGAKGINCRVGESIFGMDAKNLYRGSDTIAYLQSFFFNDGADYLSC